MSEEMHFEDWSPIQDYFEMEKMKHLEILIDLENQLKVEKLPKRRKALMGIKKKMVLWVRMLDGDSEALVELSVQRGLMSKEDAAWIRREYRKEAKMQEREVE